MSSFDDILKEIESSVNIPSEELSRKIDKKYEELSGLITKEGAALLVAREFGINIKRNLKATTIKEIKGGMKNVNITGRIFKISNINEFKKSDGSQGKVVNIWIGDDSGFLRIPLWNEQTVAIENAEFKVGDIVQIFNGLVKQNPYGYLEISLGKYGGIKIIDDTGDIPATNLLMEKYSSKNLQRVKIKDIVAGTFEVQCAIVKLFRGNFVFKSCPVCNSGMKIIDDKLKCDKHGEVEPSLFLVLSCILDDGSDDIRAVFFRDVAEKLCNIKVSDVEVLENENRSEFLSEKILGKEIIVSGKVRKNSVTGNFELIASDVKDINPLDESKKLVDTIQVSLGG